MIQNSQETEEALEDLRQTRKDTEKKLYVYYCFSGMYPYSTDNSIHRNTEIHNLKKQVNLLTTTIELVEAKASDLEMKAK